VSCHTCGAEFEVEDLIDWTQVCDDYEVDGQDSSCPECGEPIWVASWEIEDLMEVEK